jgi:hypothetical protein
MKDPQEHTCRLVCCWGFLAGLLCLSVCLVSILVNGPCAGIFIKFGTILCLSSATYLTISYLCEHYNNEHEDQGIRQEPKVGDKVTVAGLTGVIVKVMLVNADGTALQ